MGTDRSKGRGADLKVEREEERHEVDGAEDGERVLWQPADRVRPLERRLTAVGKKGARETIQVDKPWAGSVGVVKGRESESSR